MPSSCPKPPTRPDWFMGAPKIHHRAMQLTWLTGALLLRAASPVSILGSRLRCASCQVDSSGAMTAVTGVLFCHLEPGIHLVLVPLGFEACYCLLMPRATTGRPLDGRWGIDGRPSLGNTTSLDGFIFCPLSPLRVSRCRETPFEGGLAAHRSKSVSSPTTARVHLRSPCRLSPSRSSNTFVAKA